MQVIYERCAGIDVHKKTVVVCVLVAQADGTLQKQIRTFSTMTADLLALDEWLCSLLCWLLGTSVLNQDGFALDFLLFLGTSERKR